MLTAPYGYSPTCMQQNTRTRISSRQQQAATTTTSTCGANIGFQHSTAERRKSLEERSTCTHGVWRVRANKTSNDETESESSFGHDGFFSEYGTWTQRGDTGGTLASVSHTPKLHTDTSAGNNAQKCGGDGIPSRLRKGEEMATMG